MPFWEAVMLSLFEEAESAPNLLQAALFHQSRRGREMVLTREEVLKGRLEDLVYSCGPKSALSVLSEVQLAGERIGHLPFLDFHCPVAENSGRLVADVTRILFSGPGIVLNSGHSFHGVGLNIVDTEHLIDVLARALLFNPME
jgi:hypothetical protein